MLEFYIERKGKSPEKQKEELKKSIMWCLGYALAHQQKVRLYLGSWEKYVEISSRDSLESVNRLLPDDMKLS